MHVVWAWLGNSAPVASRHYLQMRDEYFAEAAERGAKSGALGASTAAQKAAQPTPAAVRHHAQETTQALGDKGFRPMLACVGLSFPDYPVPPVGLEPTTH